MTKFFRYFSLILGLLFTLQTTNAADTLDSVGYPIMYVRGINISSWAPKDSHKFTRSGNTYSLHLDALSGHFKISGDSWEYN